MSQHEYCEHFPSEHFDPVQGTWFDLGKCCFCGRWFSLGDSDEESMESAVGILAAQMALGDFEPTELHLRGYDEFLGLIWCHFILQTPTWQVGYLYGAIKHHDYD